ncbi:G2/M phase-specific E3 ubiquitin-protein ligase-like isoform X2 [Notolabrus celidotus]|uniref:G2/M phase-specific E3 ubiquitin-protein ligase-like isoform X2 n=1 Tax=Notolabrus celidotus TaxID=1203425 RepID=UPI00149068E7|nr:G2/M phase-specific E3 ubiquitin-protein ligase-like isoform X2 [Notolabrus celidotus]
MTRFQSQFRSTRPVSQHFTKEVILLPDHTATHVPRRASKAWLFERGHVKSALEFACDWDSNRIMQAIRTAFQPIVEGCRLQILLPCHNKLVEPSLSTTQSLSGNLVKKLFHQKCIYVRPDKVLLKEDGDDVESEFSGGESSLTKSSDITDIQERDKCGIGGTSEEVASTISTVEPQSLYHTMSSFSDGDEVIWCVGPSDTQDVSTDNTSILAHGPTHPSASGSSDTSYSTYLGLFEEEYLSDDPDIQEAISRSLECNTSDSDLKMTLEGVMEQITSQVNNGSTVRFNIIRRNVWDGTTRAMGRSNFSPEKKVDVKFTDDYGASEGAVDNGGPTREFFRLCLNEIKDKIGIFEGPPNAKVLTCNSKAMKDNGYVYAGQIMAMSIAHGGQSPCFLSELLYECLQKGPDDVKVISDHIADEEIRSQVQMILQAETDSQLQDAVTQAASLISVAGHSVRITLQNKEETALDLAHWYVLQRTRAPFERFRDGLTSLGILKALQRYPLQMKCLFVSTGKALTATDMENLFQIIHSERGSNAFQEECRTLAFWQDYLQDAEFEKGVCLEDILVFFTGCDSIPALGFSPKPNLEFINYSRFPVANTCENILRIPTQAVYTAFKHDMDFAIRNSPGFGRA